MDIVVHGLAHVANGRGSQAANASAAGLAAVVECDEPRVVRRHGGCVRQRNEQANPFGEPALILRIRGEIQADVRLMLWVPVSQAQHSLASVGASALPSVCSQVAAPLTERDLQVVLFRRPWRRAVQDNLP